MLFIFWPYMSDLNALRWRLWGQGAKVLHLGVLAFSQWLQEDIVFW